MEEVINHSETQDDNQPNPAQILSDMPDFNERAEQVRQYGEDEFRDSSYAEKYYEGGGKEAVEKLIANGNMVINLHSHESTKMFEEAEGYRDTYSYKVEKVPRGRMPRGWFQPYQRQEMFNSNAEYGYLVTAINYGEFEDLSWYQNCYTPEAFERSFEQQEDGTYRSKLITKIVPCKDLPAASEIKKLSMENAPQPPDFDSYSNQGSAIAALFNHLLDYENFLMERDKTGQVCDFDEIVDDPKNIRYGSHSGTDKDNAYFIATVSPDEPDKIYDRQLVSKGSLFRFKKINQE